MKLALQQAELAAQSGEVPIGAVLVLNGEKIAAAHNAPISRNDACAHAEIQAIQQACQAIGNYRLGAQATLYVTLQPCLMCLGAILHARIGRVVVGCDALANPGRSSFDTYITLERTDMPGVVHAEGGAKTVWTDFKAQKSVPMPDWLRVLVE